MWTANVDTDIFKLKTNYNRTTRTAAANSAENRERTADNILPNREQDLKQEFKEILKKNHEEAAEATNKADDAEKSKVQNEEPPMLDPLIQPMPTPGPSKNLRVQKKA